MDDTITILLPGGIPFEMILVRPGYFIMGSDAEEAFDNEKPEHIVEMKEPFYIGKYPVTQAQWKSVMGNKPSRFSGEQRPVVQVSWIEIIEGNQDEDGISAFLVQINSCLSKAGPDLAASHRFNLPTEAEWEYAAKGGPRFDLDTLKNNKAAELYPTCTGSDQLGNCGWYANNSNDETHPVGLKQANALGLYDMSGNVFEWCYDGMRRYTDCKDEVTVNPVGFTGGAGRVVRGGNYWRITRYCCSTYRFYGHPTLRLDFIGFRLVLSPSPKTTG